MVAQLSMHAKQNLVFRKETVSIVIILKLHEIINHGNAMQ